VNGPRLWTADLTPQVALSIARATITRAKNSGFPQAIFQFADGVRIRAATSQIAKDWVLMYPQRLIGIYTDSAIPEDVCADILDAAEVA
jgi:hypothetical protein